MVLEAEQVTADAGLEDGRVEAWLPVVRALPMVHAGPALRRLATLLLERDQDAAAGGLLPRGDGVRARHFMEPTQNVRTKNPATGKIDVREYL